jgi:hypothetical protein
MNRRRTKPHRLAWRGLIYTSHHSIGKTRHAQALNVKPFLPDFETVDPVTGSARQAGNIFAYAKKIQGVGFVGIMPFKGRLRNLPYRDASSTQRQEFQK